VRVPTKGESMTHPARFGGERRNVTPRKSAKSHNVGKGGKLNESFEGGLGG